MYARHKPTRWEIRDIHGAQRIFADANFSDKFAGRVPTSERGTQHHELNVFGFQYAIFLLLVKGCTYFYHSIKSVSKR